jgi:hypothetical protein
MKIYLVVEGRKSEENLYPKWIKYINEKFEIVYRIEDMVDNSIMLISGCGYPQYFDIIRNSIDDIKKFNVFDKLIIAVDSENCTYEEKFNEINDFLLSTDIPIPYEIIIQHFCIETWALGNKKIYKRNAESAKLKSYQRIFNVAKYDPELLPANDEEQLNRAQFANKYLNLLLHEKYEHLSYKKGSPKEVGEKYYFEQILKRYENGHIKSFKKFLDCFY